jgi:hypothetical protein
MFASFAGCCGRTIHAFWMTITITMTMVTFYDKAWNSGNVGAARVAARAAAIQNAEREREVQRWTHNRVMLAIFGFDGQVRADGTMVHEPI